MFTWFRTMGNSHSHPPGHDYNGPLFGGHYRGDFSIRGNAADVNKPLPPPPGGKTVRFGADPPPWMFYKDRPSDENLGNTRYCSPPEQYGQLPSPSSSMSPPPAYGTWDEKGFTIRNQ